MSYKNKSNSASKICDYDEGYDRADAYEICWCYKCKANTKCPYKLKAIKEVFGVEVEYK